MRVRTDSKGFIKTPSQNSQCVLGIKCTSDSRRHNEKTFSKWITIDHPNLVSP